MSKASVDGKPVRLVRLFIVSLPIFGEGVRRVEAFEKKSAASARFRDVVAELKALAKKIKGFPKNAAPGEAPPQPPVFGDVRLLERTYAREKASSLLAKSVNNALSHRGETELKSYLFQNPNAPKPEESAPAATSEATASG